MDKVNLSKRIEEVREKYNKIHKILFTYGIFLLIAIFAGIKVYTILSTENTDNITEDPLEIQRNIKKKEFINKLKLIEKQQSLTWPIALWQFQETQEYIESFNNLLYYKWFIIPRFFSISKTAPLENIEYFNKGTYTIDELDTLFKNVFIGSNKSTKQTIKNSSFPLLNWLMKEFNLECVFQSKISSFVCNAFISNFLDNFFIYNIQTDNDIFLKIMNTLLQERKYNEKWCEQLLYYTYYTEAENRTIETLLEKCHPNYQEKYRLFVDFSEVQKELFSKFISNKIYKDEIINTYKLISFQQIINDDIINKVINTDRINGYFWFLQEVLKRDKIWLFYKELTYFFNNYYLKKAIENIELTNKITNKTELDNITKQIIWINNGNQLIWYVWLREQINKNILEKEIIINQWSTGNKNYEEKIEILLKQIKDLEIKQKFLSGNNILLYGIRKIETKNDNYNLGVNIISVPTKLRLEENKNTLILKQIMLEWFDEISQTINKLIGSKSWSFADLQKYLYQNTALFWETSVINEEEIIKMCKTLTDTLKEQEIKSCNSNKIEVDIIRKNKVITMTITHDNFILNKIDVSDENAKIQLNNYLSDPDIASQITYNKVTKSDFIPFIQTTIAGFISFVPKTDPNFEGSSNTIIIIERVKKYLWIQVNDIIEKNDKILLDFAVGWIPFLGYYNLEENRIYPIYFKEANEAKKPVAIKNLWLTLSEENKSFLSIFLLQPLEVIKQYSPEEYLLYQKFISEKQ